MTSVNDYLRQGMLLSELLRKGVNVTPEMEGFDYSPNVIIMKLDDPLGNGTLVFTLKTKGWVVE